MSGMKKRKLPEKIFIGRNSLLTDLFENVHIKTVYHIFVATLIGLFINSTAFDYLKNGDNESVKFGLKMIKSSFGGFHLMIVSWITNFILTCCTFVAFNIWAQGRKRHRISRHVWDSAWLCLCAIYYTFSFYFAVYLVQLFQLAPISAAVVIIEQTRLLMKVHSFIRTNAPTVLKHNIHTDNHVTVPNFTKFLYFLFAPTLIYRDEYPRTAEIRWRFVFFYVIEIIGVMFFLSFVLERFLKPSLHDFGKRQFTINEVILIVLDNTASGFLCMVALNYLILHCWQNMFAEITQFGDRLFYKDWWTSTSYSTYYRTWNVVVHDWLYTYIYKDMYEIFTANNEILSKWIVFIISAIVHEWILTFMFGYFFPALLIDFLIFGGMLNFIHMPNTSFVNILFLYSVASGSGILMCMYAMEYYARQNAPIDNATLKDFITPRLFTCNCIKF